MADRPDFRGDFCGDRVTGRVMSEVIWQQIRHLPAWPGVWMLLSLCAIGANSVVAMLIFAGLAVVALGLWVWRHHGAARYVRMTTLLGLWSWGLPTAEMVRAVANLGWNLRPLALRASLSGDLRGVGRGDGFGHEIPSVRWMSVDGRRLVIRLVMPPGLSAAVLIDAPDVVAAAMRVPEVEIWQGADAATAVVAVQGLGKVDGWVCDLG